MRNGGNKQKTNNKMANLSPNISINTFHVNGLKTPIKVRVFCKVNKNNNPTKGRIIGKIHNKVFYIFYIDAKGVLYKHE